MNPAMNRVVIIGAGFAGLFAARTFLGTKTRVTLIDRNNYHTFNPLLYQVGAAEVEPSEIAYPVRSVLRAGKNISFLMAEVTGVNSSKNMVTTDRGDLHYDYLVIATGSRPDYYGIRGAEDNTLDLNTLNDAIKLRNHILCSFEKASQCDDAGELEKLLTFVIIGGGPTGVEYAGAFAELVHGPLHRDFPALDLSRVKIFLIDAAPGLLAGYSRKSALYTGKKLERMGVTVRLGSPVKRIDNEAVVLSDGEIVRAATILWAAGVRGEALKTDLSPPAGPRCRVGVTATLQLAEQGNIFICGDMAYFEQEGGALPMMAPVATQQGAHAAKNILRIMKGQSPVDFRFRGRGAMVTIGRNSAVARIGSFEIKGFAAWILWLAIHIFFLIGFRNKIFVLIKWFGDYIFFERSGRMIIPSCDDGMKLFSVHEKVKRH